MPFEENQKAKDETDQAKHKRKHIERSVYTHYKCNDYRIGKTKKQRRQSGDRQSLLGPAPLVTEL